ncbi:MAG: nucleoside phosphorylase [Bacteroidetes bacterium]|nr:nucleoside phosphorylase [Bacteroidota bacterium]MDA0859766.1 nucleoside phosphorylase [Bacteroidota bacterium]MDA1317648.1 nucleoside phosphorylase [Bacteroidota bacterium]
MSIKKSELILNPDGSIYHLNLRPEHLAPIVITVGDPDRVDHVSRYFDTIEFKIQKREFKTHTGVYKNQQISVISTGIGSDNIDIVLNELDALVNIDFKTRRIKPDLTSLKIVRIGTSGALQSDIPVDSFLLSSYAIDINGMLQSYQIKRIQNTAIETAFCKHTNWDSERAKPVVVQNSKSLETQLLDNNIQYGITATCGGFYGPQDRILRLQPKDSIFRDKLQSFRFENLRITNFEMETSAIYGLSKLLGHQACSMNAILANRVNGTFSKNSEETVDLLIKYTLKKLTC